MNCEDDDLSQAFAELRNEDPPPAALAAMRTHVLTRVNRRTARPSLAWVGAGALAAACAVGLFFVVESRSPEAEFAGLKLPPAVATPTVPEDALPRPGVKAVSMAGHARGHAQERAMSRSAIRASVRLRKPASATVDFIHLITEDPDVVILWAVDSKGDTE